MKGITITKENLNYVLGRLNKFFFNNNHTGFSVWYNCNCGSKKHIEPQLGNIDYRKAESISVDFNSVTIWLSGYDPYNFNIGDKIDFRNNKIIHKAEWFFNNQPTRRFIYTVFQVKPEEE